MLTVQQLQVHDLLDDQLKVIYQEVIKGAEYTSVDIAGDKLVVGLCNGPKGENVGTIRIYRMNAPTYSGHRFEILTEDISLPALIDDFQLVIEQVMYLELLNR